MITFQPEAEPNVVDTVITGKLDKTDYNKLVPALETKMKENGKINWMIHLRDFEGWTGAALIEDIKMNINHANGFDRIAVVGDKTWHETMAQAVSPFAPQTVKYFEPSQELEARTWVKGLS